MKFDSAQIFRKDANTVTVATSKNQTKVVPRAKLDGDHLAFIQKMIRQEVNGDQAEGRRLFAAYVNAAIQSKTILSSEGGAKPVIRDPDSRHAAGIRRRMASRLGL
ncbi:MAG: hypothetical protein AAF569_08800 [Pseudomonadota bacterium]